MSEKVKVWARCVGPNSLEITDDNSVTETSPDNYIGPILVDAHSYLGWREVFDICDVSCRSWKSESSHD